MTQTCNLWLKWIALETNHTFESQINNKTDNDQPYPIKQSTIISMQSD